MLNLYEILEVSEKASKEVIEKAYHVLAKKYHPDLQGDAEKQEAERKMKEINEAYDILMDEEKRKQYDLELEQERQEEKEKIEQEYKTQIENDVQKREQNRVYTQNQEVVQANENYQRTQAIEYQKKQMQMEYENRQKMQNEINKAYNDAYYTYLRRLRI